MSWAGSSLEAEAVQVLVTDTVMESNQRSLGEPEHRPPHTRTHTVHGALALSSPCLGVGPEPVRAFLVKALSREDRAFLGDREDN